VRSRAMSVILIATAAACAPSAPATRPSPDAGVPPVRALLGERDRLSLTGTQVVALDSISRELDVTDRVVSHRLGIIKGGLAPRPGRGKPREGLGTVAEKQSRAARAVEQLLRPDQRQRLCELSLERQGKVALRDDKRALTGHSFASSRRQPTETRGAWPWCGSPAQSHG
jgi:hypothetical protein